MSTTPRSSAHSTRQQLDDLDALLQRMLELPVQPPEESEPVSTENRGSPASPVLRPEPQAPREPRSVAAEPHRPVTAGPRLRERATARKPVEPPRRIGANQTPNSASPATADSPARPGRAVTPTPIRLHDSGPPLPGVLAPVVWMNTAFDEVMGKLGSAGGWARQPGGRQVLGWTGLLLLGSAVALLLFDRFGWTW